MVSLSISVAASLGVLIAASAAGLVGCDAADGGTPLKARLEAAQAARAVITPTAEQLAEAKTLQVVLRQKRTHLGGLRGLVFELDTTLSTRSDGEQQARVSSTSVFKTDRAGNFWVREDNTWRSLDGSGAEGRGCGVVDGTYYTEQAGRPATRVVQRDDEAKRCRSSALEPVIGLLIPHLSRLVYTVQPTIWRGRSAARILFDGVKPGVAGPPLALAWPDANPNATQPEQSALFGPRGSLFAVHTRPAQMTGSLTILRASGAPVDADLQGVFRLVKAGKDAELHFELKLSGRGYAATVPTPQDPRLSSPRPRFFDEHRALLKALDVVTLEDAQPLPKPGDAPKLKLVVDEGSNEDTPNHGRPDEDAP